MRLSRSAILFTCFIILSGIKAFAGVDFNIYPNGAVLGPAVTFTDISATEAEIREHPENLLKNNDEQIPYGFALANTFGYPNGKAIIPNFEAGIATGVAVYQYDRYENFSKDNPKIPGAGANAAMHFGFGVTEDTDITFKLFINQGMYSPDTDISKDSDTRSYDITLDETDLVSIGVKGRYNLVGATSLVPVLFSFGGITAGVAVDYSHGKVSSSATYIDRRSVSFTGTSSFSGDSFTQTVDVETEVSGKATMEWNIVSVTPEIMTYIDLLYFFTIYTGPAVSLNAGTANFNMTANGALRNLDPVYADEAGITTLAGPNETIATGNLSANMPYDVPLAVPLWKLGLEINLMAFKIQAEAATVLTSPADSFTAQFGLRVQF